MMEWYLIHRFGLPTTFCIRFYFVLLLGGRHWVGKRVKWKLVRLGQVRGVLTQRPRPWRVYGLSFGSLCIYRMSIWAKYGLLSPKPLNSCDGSARPTCCAIFLCTGGSTSKWVQLLIFYPSKLYFCHFVCLHLSHSLNRSTAAAQSHCPLFGRIVRSSAWRLFDSFRLLNPYLYTSLVSAHKLGQ